MKVLPTGRGFSFKALLTFPSFSVLNSKRDTQSFDTTHTVLEIVCTGVDAFVPFVGMIPRVAIGAMNHWTEKKHEMVRYVCNRLEILYTQAVDAMGEKRVTRRWVGIYEAVLLEFIVFAAGYEKKRRIVYRISRKITSADDQKMLAIFTNRIDALFLELKGVSVASGNGDADKDDDSASDDSASTAGSSP